MRPALAHALNTTLAPAMRRLTDGLFSQPLRIH
jgi:hypothetical protein